MNNPSSRHRATVRYESRGKYSIEYRGQTVMDDGEIAYWGNFPMVNSARNAVNANGLNDDGTIAETIKGNS